MNDPKEPVASALPDEVIAAFDADGEGPALPIQGAAARRMIDDTLAGFAAEKRCQPSRGRGGRKLAIALSAAAVLCSSAAAMYLAGPLAPWSDPGSEQRPTDRGRGKAPIDRSAAPSEEAEPAAIEQSEPPSSPDPAQARDLLRRANSLRGRGAYRAAERTYLKVVAQHPSGSSAYSARVAAADLRHERLSDPEGALTLYREALRDQPDGPLSPEIDQGMARALRKLGREDAERGR